jgi:hypothetical protein
MDFTSALGYLNELQSEPPKRMAAASGFRI